MTVKLLDKSTNKETIVPVKKIYIDDVLYFKFYYGNGKYSEEYTYDRYSFEILI